MESLYAAMIVRTSQLELITEDQKLYLFRQIASNKWKTKEPLDDTILVERPSLYKKVFQMIVDNDILRKNEILAQLALPQDELEKSLNITIDPTVDLPRPRPVLKIVK